MKVGELQLLTNVRPVKPQQVKSPDLNSTAKSIDKAETETKSFQDILADRVKETTSLRFSAHAVRRLGERQIDLSSENLNRLQDGLNRIEEKGGRSSLILMDDMAYIVSVNNKTVVTLLKTDAMMNNVFTNIDSVAIV